MGSYFVVVTGIINWQKEEFQSQETKTGKLLTHHGVFHFKNDISRLYFLRRNMDTELISFEESVNAEESNLRSDVSNGLEPLLTQVKK